MAQKIEPVSAEVVRIIEETVRERMTPFGCRAVHVRGGLDHDGDPVIYVEVEYDLSNTPLEHGVTAKVAATTRERVWATGEDRFAHIRHLFPDDDTVLPRKKKAKAD